MERAPCKSCMAGAIKLPYSVFKKYTLCHVPVLGRVVLMHVSIGRGLFRSIAVVATVVATRFTDGGSNEKQRFEIDGDR